MKPPKKLLAIDWHAGEFPTLPGVAKKILAMQGRDDVDVTELENIISQEPALTLKVMKVVNSGYYGMTTEITSVRHAVTLLGISTVLQLIISTVLANRFMTVSKDVVHLARRLYRHCITTAIFARDLEFEMQEPDPYTLGLLHDIGWLPLMAQAPDLLNSMFLDENLSRSELEEAWGTDHQLWGAKLAEIWGLPEPFMITAYRHHRPLMETSPPRYLIMVTIAHHLANAAGQSLFTHDIEPMAPEIIESAGIDQDTFAQMEAAAVDDRERIESVCNIILA